VVKNDYSYEIEELDEQLLKDMLYQMMLIRRFEQSVEQLYAQGKISGSMHLCIGQEPSAAGSIAALENKDKILTTHRGHGHSIAKGTDINGMMAELLGKETGICKGKGGSMHIADIDVGNLGANGIVGGGLPIACGAAYTAKMKSLDYVTVCYFGDGATNEGTFHESLNLASIWDLPVIFFCENNQYGMSGAIEDMINIENISDRSKAYGIPGETIDGTDAVEVYLATAKAVERARRGEGPTLIEAKTYRWKGHSRSDARKYRTREEENYWIENRDGIEKLKNQLMENGVMKEAEFEKIQDEVDQRVKQAVKFAEDSPEPSVDSIWDNIFA